MRAQPNFGTIGVQLRDGPRDPGAVWVLWKEHRGELTKMTNPGSDRKRLQQLADFLSGQKLAGQRGARYIVRHR